MIINEDSLLCAQNTICDDVQHAKERLLNVLENRQVVKVSLMANFGYDHDAELYFGYPIVRGVVVCVPMSFECIHEDKLWIHPFMDKERKIIQIENLNECVDPGRFGDCIGTYADGNGIAFDGNINKIIISDVASTNNTHEDIINGLLPLRNAVYNSEVCCNRYNDVRSDGTYLYVFNHVCRIKEGDVMLIGLGTMRGYTQVIASHDTSIPVDFGYENRVSWDEMEIAYVTALYKTCRWAADIPYNIQIMRRMKNLVPGQITNWCLQHKCHISHTWNTFDCVLSSNDIRKQLIPEQAIEFLPPQRFFDCLPNIKCNESTIPVHIQKIGDIIEKYSRIKQQCPNFQLFHETLNIDDESFIYLPKDVLIAYIAHSTEETV